MVLVLTGILAVVAMPRLASVQGFRARGFHDGTMAALRLAQKTAIAQRRTVCVGFTSASVALTLRTAPNDASCAYAAGAGETGLGADGVAYVVTAPAGVSYASVPGNFGFSPLGQASAATVVSIAGEQDILVEAETGYIHSP